MRARSFLLPAGLFVLAFLLFAQSLRNEFTNWDDVGYVLENPAIRKLDLQSAGEMFNPSSVLLGDWAPVTIFSFAVDYAIWELRPIGYHLTNVLLHALCTVLLYLLLARLLGRGDPRRGTAAAAIAALLFAVHPVQVESVTWVAERKNVLGMALMLAAFLAWLRATRERFRPGAYLIFLALFILSLLAKAQAVILPPLLLLHEWIERHGIAASPKSLVARAALVAPAFAAAILVGMVTLDAQGTVEQSRFTGDLVGTAATLPTLILGYVRDLLLPMNRSAILSPPLYKSLWSPVPALSWLMVAAWGMGSLAAARRLRHVAFFSLWFLGALAPVLNIVPLPVVMADRYQYWAAPGLFALAGLGAVGLWRAMAPSRRTVSAFLAAAMVLCLVVLTLARIPVWHDSISLWTDAVHKRPQHVIIRTNLGAALLRAGKAREALPHLVFAMGLQPNDHRLRLNLGVAYLKVGRPEDAVTQATVATRLNDRSLKGWLLLGTSLAAVGRNGEAALALEQALQIRPNHPDALALLRMLPGKRGGAAPGEGGTGGGAPRGSER